MKDLIELKVIKTGISQLETEVATQQERCDREASRLTLMHQKISELRSLSEQPTTAIEIVLPNSSDIRSMIRNILMERSFVTNSEVRAAVHEVSGVHLPPNGNDSPLSARVYSVLSGLADAKLIKRTGASKKTNSITSKGKKKKNWA